MFRTYSVALICLGFSVSAFAEKKVCKGSFIFSGFEDGTREGEIEIQSKEELSQFLQGAEVRASFVSKGEVLDKEPFFSAVISPEDKENMTISSMNVRTNFRIAHKGTQRGMLSYDRERSVISFTTVGFYTEGYDTYFTFVSGFFICEDEATP